VNTTTLARMAMAVAAVMLAHQVAGKAVRDALFLGAMPVTDLPRMVILAAALSLAAVPVYSRLLSWVGPRVLVPVGFLSSAVAHVAEWYWFGTGTVVPVIVYLHVAAFGALLLSGFWSLTSELFDPHTAKRHVLRIATAGSLGGIVGGVIVERIGAWATADASLLLLAACHGLCAVGLLPLCTRVRESASTTAAPESLFGPGVLRSSPQIREIAALVMLGTASAAILDYLLKSRAAADFSGNDLLQFFAIFYAGIQLVTFLFQVVFAAPLQKQLGIGRSVTALPLGVGAGAVVALLFPATVVVALARGTEFVLRGSLFRSGYELLFSAMAPVERRRVKTFLDVSCDRAGDALGAAVVQLLIMAGPWFLVSELLAVVLLMVAASIWLGERLDANYLRSIEQRLVDQAAATGMLSMNEFGAPSLLSIEVPIIEPPMALEDVVPGHREHVSVSVLLDEPLDLLRQLRSGDRERVLVALESSPRFEAMHVAQAVQLLAWDDVTPQVRRALERSADRHVGLLVDALLDGSTDFAIRRRIPRVLICAPTQRTLDGLVNGLGDSRFEVRYQCSRAMDRVLVAEPMLKVDAARIFSIIERELSVARPVWNGHRLLDQFESSDAVMFLDEHLRDRANRSLEHVFSLLVTVLPREPVKVAFRTMHSDDRMLRGLALEYLTGVLPETVRKRLWDILDAGDVRRLEPRAENSASALEELLRSQDGLLQQLTRPVTGSGDDAPGQSDPPRPASPPSTRR
jgi:AAA family ATP:ADP antiporter